MTFYKKLEKLVNRRADAERDATAASARARGNVETRRWGVARRDDVERKASGVVQGGGLLSRGVDEGEASTREGGGKT